MKATKDMVGKTIVWQERADAKSEWEPEQSAVIDRVGSGDCAINEGTEKFPRISWLGVNDESEIYFRVVRIEG
jgi:hypothetical protein